MDNRAYDALNLSPSNDDYDTYSKLSTVQQFATSRVHTRIQLQDKSGRIQSELNEVRNNNIISKPPAQRKKNLLVVVATALLMAILLLTSIVSIALSIGAYTRSVSNEFNGHSKINQDLSSVQIQLAANQANISNILTQLNQDLLSVKTELLTIQSKLSQTLPQLDARIEDFISIVQTQNASLQTQLYCGQGQWRRVAYLNMRDPTEQCPPSWKLYNNSGVRACGRRGPSGCMGMSYSTGYQYRSVCGRVIGYQKGTPDAFRDNSDPDGITITHGLEHMQHSRIWSYVAGVFEMIQHQSNCPCNGGTPSSIGSNYYCESGNPNDAFDYDKLYSDDKLWDGQHCDSEGSCCTSTDSTRSPPWFSVRLPAPTNDNIEVRICGDQSTSNEDTPIELLEIFVG